MLFVKDGIITFPLDRYSFPVGFETFCIELNLRKKKGLIFCIYTLSIDSLNIISKNWEKPLNFTRKHIFHTLYIIIMGVLMQKFLSLIWHLSVRSITLKV